MIKANIGSVSHGTLKLDDLLNALSAELEHHVQRNAEAWCSDAGRDERDRLCDLIFDARECRSVFEGQAEDILQELIDALQQFAPDHAYFGAHEGDGADFGFWKQDES